MKKKATNNSSEESLSQKDKSQLQKAAVSAINKIIAIAESEDTDTKVKIDAYKWICEMYFGKPQSAQRADSDGEKTLHLSFEGELDKWSN